jgi:LysM repeat protein
VIHTARKGETALSVADDYAVPVEMVRKWNHLHGNQLRTGQTLHIYKPVGKQAAREPSASRNAAQRTSASTRPGSAKAKPGTAARSGSKTPAKAGTAHPSHAAAASKTTAKTTPTAKGKSSSASAGRPSPQRVHKVRRGDTLNSIASEYKTTVAALKRDNGKATGNLRPGQVLVIK